MSTDHHYFLQIFRFVSFSKQVLEIIDLGTVDRKSDSTLDHESADITLHDRAKLGK